MYGVGDKGWVGGEVRIQLVQCITQGEGLCREFTGSDPVVFCSQSPPCFNHFQLLIPWHT